MKRKRDPRIQRMAVEHMIAVSAGQYASVDIDLLTKIADAYDSAPHKPQDANVRRAYRAFKAETMEQFIRAKRHISFEPWTSDGQPYASSVEMSNDVRRNGHLYFFLGGEWLEEHPMAELSPLDCHGRPLTYNDLFRGVHDLYGHALHNFEFGPRGEENAYRSHSVIYLGDTAKAALATETRGQNAWINFGPHLRRSDGSFPSPQEPDYIPLARRPYAPQKATLLPEWSWRNCN